MENPESGRLIMIIENKNTPGKTGGMYFMNSIL